MLPAVTVDCANGVGAPKLKELVKVLGTDFLPVVIVRDNTTTAGQLNFQCGADFVKTGQRGPVGVELVPWQRYASFDGDADRIVYYYAAADADADNNHGATFHLLDGDKIATLAAGFILDLVRDAGLADEVKVGVVQTAYANGASTKYLTDVLVSHSSTRHAFFFSKPRVGDPPASGIPSASTDFLFGEKNLVQGVPVTCVPTGVKHLHHAAEAYDVGVYFEANGHGTVLFSPAALSKIRTPPAHDATESAAAPATTTAAVAAASRLAALENLRSLTDLINQTVGDALSDLLLVETVLLHRQWTPAEWDRAYTDYPNRLVKVLVADRHAFETTDAERRLVKPEGLQARIDLLCAEVDGGRSFVRPSGTEDCVRVYAEATTREAADGAFPLWGCLPWDVLRFGALTSHPSSRDRTELVNKVAYLVFDEAGGKGTRPAAGFF